MSQSLTKIYAHLIFRTKNRERWLDHQIRPRVHGYLATVIRGHDSPWVMVGGVEDHVHVLFDIGKKTAPVKFVEQVKGEYGLRPKRACFSTSWGVAPGYGDEWPAAKHPSSETWPVRPKHQGLKRRR